MGNFSFGLLSNERWFLCPPCLAKIGFIPLFTTMSELVWWDELRKVLVPFKFKNGYRNSKMIWARAWQNQQNDLCTRWRPRSAWALAHSDQSSLCTLGLAKDPRLLHADSKGSNQIGQMPSWSKSSLGAQAILLVLSCSGSFVIFLHVFCGLIYSLVLLYLINFSLQGMGNSTVCMVYV